MKAVKVEYTVRPEYVDTNKANIKKVMDRLREHPIDGMMYSSYTKDDGQTFVHINICRDQETMSRLGELPEFNEFQKALKASGPVSPPQASKLDLVAAGFDI